MTQKQVVFKRQQDIKRFLDYSKTIGLLNPFTVVTGADGSWSIEMPKKK
jgi:hypothetical protein